MHHDQIEKKIEEYFSKKGFLRGFRFSLDYSLLKPEIPDKLPSYRVDEKKRFSP